MEEACCKCGNDGRNLWKGMDPMRMQKCGNTHGEIGVDSEKDAMEVHANTGREKASCPLESGCTLLCIGHIPWFNHPT